MALTGVEIGLLVCAIGAMLGGMTGVGIVGVATGGVAGFKLGAAINRNILHNLHRRDCDHTLGDRS